MGKKEKIKVHSIWDEAELKKNGFDKFPALWEDGMRTSGEKMPTSAAQKHTI